MTPLAAVLALVLAYSKPDYAQIAPGGPYTLLVSHGTYWSPCDYDHQPKNWLAETDFRCRYITLSETVTQPALEAALIVGEAKRSQFDPKATPDYNIELVGTTDAQHFAEWFTRTFGPPTFTDPAQANQWQATLYGDTQQTAAYGASLAHS